MKNRLILCAFLQVLSVWSASLQAAPGYGNHLDQARSLSNAGNYAEADKSFEQAYRLAADDDQKATVLAWRGEMMAFRQKNYPDAMAQVKFAEKFTEGVNDKTKVVLLQVEARCLMLGEKKYKEAASLLQEAVKYTGPEVEYLLNVSYLMLGDAYQFAKKDQEALDAYADLLKWDKAKKGAKASAHMSRGIIYQFRLEKEDLAREEYYEAVKLNPRLQTQADELTGRMDKD